MIDLNIIGGTVVDGTGAPARVADVSIDAGRVVAISHGAPLPDARRTIDATGRLVTPGFVDPHTHMDAQLWWDPTGAPSVLHGVTSVVIGSCGFGVAPVAPGTEEYVLRSLESVEEIPYEATRQGLPMTWSTWPEFFEQLGAQPLGINVAGFVPHSALRVGVLGNRSPSGPVTADQRRELAAALRDAIDAGAVGMSSSRGSNHTDAAGAPMASRYADDDELLALVELCAGRTWQINIAAKGDNSPDGIRRALAELAVYDGMAHRTGSTVTWTPLVVGPGDDVAWRRLLEFAEGHQDRSVPQVCAEPIVSAISFDGPSYAAMVEGWAPSFSGYGGLTAEQRIARLRDAGFRDALRAVPENPARITAPSFGRWRVAISPTSPDAIGLTLREYAETLGAHPIDAMLDLAIADGLGTVIEAPLSNLDEGALQQLVASPSTIFGIGDAGAHVKSITNYTYPTTVLGELSARRGWLPLEEAVRQLTSRPAEVFHLDGRGVLRAGAHADVCVIDLDRLGTTTPQLVADLPGGQRRLHCAATGYDAVIVNGHVVVDHDVLIPTPAGHLLRVRS